MPEMSAEMDGKNRLEEGENRMKCPKCGQEAVGNFCSNCGTPLVNDTVRREQETVGRKPENSYDDGDSEQWNPARMESDEKKAESGSEGVLYILRTLFSGCVFVGIKEWSFADGIHRYIK